MKFHTAVTILLYGCYSYCAILMSSNGNIVIGRKLFTVLKNRPYVAFYRIPYADPPVGELRFKPPKERKFWTDNINYNFSQSEDVTCSTSYEENCLHLSIYKPLSFNKTRYPVMVWVHESSDFHGPDFFIDEGVLIVSVSFRTSIFGFLCTDDNFAAGNMGGKDVLMALKWIRYNINHFSGDSSKVTVAGSGQGSTIVASLPLSVAAEDFYSRIIVLSGSALSPADYRLYSFELQRKLYVRLTGPQLKFNREHFYELLNTVPTAKLQSISWDLFDSSEVRDSQRLINSFGCIVETTSKPKFMSKTPAEVYKRQMANNNVDVMFGFTTLERLNKLGGLAANRKLLKYFNYNFQYLLPFDGRRDEYNSKRYKRIRQRIMDFYFLNGTIGERSLRRYAKFHSDQIVYPLLRQATLQCESSCNNVYLYRFGFKGAFNIEWKSSVPNLNWTGATSGDEICYLFRCKSVNDDYKSGDTRAERCFITKIVRLMANFVKYGNPTPKKNDTVLSTLQWEPLHRGQHLRGMSLASKLKMVNLPEERRMKFWDRLRQEFFYENIIRDEL